MPEPAAVGSAVMPRLTTLSRTECLKLLGSRYLGRLAYLADGQPHIIPLNYVVDGDNLVVRMDCGGALAAVAASPAVAFEVDHADYAYHSGWSVVAHGPAAEVTAPAEFARMRLLPLRPWAPGDRGHYVRITPVRLTGRRIT